MSAGSGTANGRVSRTLSEIASTCQKAARGAGCPWGLAEEAGHAVRVLESYGLPGVQSLAILLETPRACPCDGRADRPACGIAELARLSDTMFDFDDACDSVTETVAGPLLLAAPLLRLASVTGEAHLMAADDYSLICSASGISVDPDSGMPPATGRVTIRKVKGRIDTEPPDWRCREVSFGNWRKLEALAARTLVPESDTSRAQGAGPDMSDND